MAIAVATSPISHRHRAPAQAGAGAHAGMNAGMNVGGALLLSLALLFSQFLGLFHGIAHAGWPVSIERTAQASANAALFNYFDADDGADDRADDANAAETDGADGRNGKAVSQSDASHGKHHHSCVEYDAAAGAAGIHVKLYSPPLIPGVQVLALWQAFASWDAAVVCHFSSRAPPR